MVCPFETCDYPRPNWAPSEPLARQRARSGTIQTSEASEPSEMLRGLRRGLRDDRQLQAPTDHLSDIAHGHALFGNRVITAGRTLLERQPVETRGIGQVRRRPSIPTVGAEHREALLPAEGHQIRDTSLLVVIVTPRK